MRDALKTALGDVGREDREKQTSMSARDAASTRFTQVYSGVASILAGLCWLAGLDDLADSVRPTERRRAGMVDDATPAVVAGDSAATKPPDTGGSRCTPGRDAEGRDRPSSRVERSGV